MLDFQQTPDVIFYKIIENAINYSVPMIEDTEDGDYYEIMPYASKIFKREDALKAISELLKYHKAAGVWYITDYYYLLLYDMLDSYISMINDEGDINKYLKIDKYKIKRIDYEALLNLYFYDLDFLFGVDDNLVIANPIIKKNLRISDESCKISNRMLPDKNDLRIWKNNDNQEKGDKPVKTRMYGKGSTEYPDFEYFKKHYGE